MIPEIKSGSRANYCLPILTVLIRDHTENEKREKGGRFVQQSDLLLHTKLSHELRNVIGSDGSGDDDDQDIPTHSESILR